MNNTSDDKFQLDDEFDLENIKRKIFKDSIGAVSVLDINGKIESVNEDFKKLFRYDDLIGKDITEFILKNEKWNNILTSLNTDNESTGEIELQTKDGSTFNSYYIADLIRNKKSKPVLIAVNFIPENETYKVIKQLRGSKRTYQNICNTYEYLYQATLTLAKKTDLKDIIKTIADEAKNLMGASDCTVYLANYEKEVLEPFYTNDPKYKEQIMSYDIPFGEGEAGRVVEKGKSRFLNVDDQREHLVTIPGTKNGDTEEESILTVPLFKDDKINGVLSLSKKRYRFDYEDINKLKAFAKQAETVLSRADDLEKLQKSKEMISREKQKIEALHNVARDLEKCDSEEKMYEITIDAAKNILDFYICSIMIYEDGDLVIKSTFDEDVNIGDKFSVEEGIYGKTYREQKSYLVNDISNYESAKPTSDDLKAVLSVPIDRFGVFQTLSDRRDFFDEDDLEITELLISHVKEAIRQVRNKNLIEERERKLEALHDVSAKLESCSSEAEAYNMIVSASEDVLNFDICRIYGVEGDKFSVKAVSSKVDKQQEDYEIPLNKGIVGKTYLNNESYLINDFKNNDESVPFLNDYKSGISVPIGKYGVLQAVSYESDDFNKEDVEMAELLTSHLSEALNRIKSDNRERFLLTLLRHDMMNKSQIVRGYLQILLDMEPTDEQKRFIDSAMKANIESQELLSKIGVLKDIKNVKEMKETKLDLAITHAIDENINPLRDKSIKIKFDKKGFQVLGGPLLEELFSNLIENAVNHAECDFISISSKEEENTVRVIVEDNGMGLSDDIKNRVLKKGFKGKSSKGLGLGTFLVKSIAEIYNGYVEVKNSELGGARFDVILRKA